MTAGGVGDQAGRRFALASAAPPMRAMRRSPKGVPMPLLTMSATASSRRGIGEGAGAAEAEVPEGAARNAAGGEHAMVSEPPSHLEGHDESAGRRRLHLGRARERPRGEEPHAVELAAARERGVHARERPRGEEAVGGRNRNPQRLVGTEVEGGDAARRQRIEDARQVDPDPGEIEPALEHPQRLIDEVAELVAPDPHEPGLEEAEDPAARPDEPRGAMELVGRCADVEAVEVERLGDELADQPREGLAGHALDEPADEEAVGEPVVAGPHARLVRGRRPLDRAQHVLPVEHARRAVHHLADVVEPGLVREHLADGDRLLAGLSELGPVLGDGRS